MRNAPVIVITAVGLMIVGFVAIASFSGATKASHNCINFTPGTTPVVPPSNGMCGADNWSLDMDPAATPANTATSLGSNEQCAQINENNIMDADEDSVDAVNLDVTATNIPQSNPMTGFSFTLNYDSTSLTVDNADPNFLLTSAGGSGPIANASDTIPDNNADNQWSAKVRDTNPAASESGSGVLDRLTVSTEATAIAGQYLLSLSNAFHLDSNNDTQPSDTLTVGNIAVNQACGPIITPTGSPSNPTPTPTPTPSNPTPTPTPTQSLTDTPSPTPTPTHRPTPTPAVTPTSTTACGDDNLQEEMHQTGRVEEVNDEHKVEDQCDNVDDKDVDHEEGEHDHHDHHDHGDHSEAKD